MLIGNYSEKDQTFTITDENDNCVFSVAIENIFNQITITTNKEVYSGPIDLIAFKEDVK